MRQNAATPNNPHSGRSEAEGRKAIAIEASGLLLLLARAWTSFAGMTGK
jgi:hypothetical protein